MGVGHRTDVSELGQFFDIVRYQQWVELGKGEEFGVWEFFVGWNPEGKVMPTSRARRHHKHSSEQIGKWKHFVCGAFCLLGSSRRGRLGIHA